MTIIQILLTIYFSGFITSWVSLLTFKKWNNVDVWDLFLFAPILSVGSWFTVGYFIWYIKNQY